MHVKDSWTVWNKTFLKSSRKRFKKRKILSCPGKGSTYSPLQVNAEVKASRTLLWQGSAPLVAKWVWFCPHIAVMVDWAIKCLISGCAPSWVCFLWVWPCVAVVFHGWLSWVYTVFHLAFVKDFSASTCDLHWLCLFMQITPPPPTSPQFCSTESATAHYLWVLHKGSPERRLWRNVLQP